jgi:hypothetical protein
VIKYKIIEITGEMKNGGWWLVAGEWLLNPQFVFNNPMNQVNWKLSNHAPATSHQPPATIFRGQ